VQKCVDFCSSYLIFYLGAAANAVAAVNRGYLRLLAAICGYLRPRQWLLLLTRPNIEIALQKFLSMTLKFANVKSNFNHSIFKSGLLR
jgi:hypothetical protein